MKHLSPAVLLLPLLLSGCPGNEDVPEIRVATVRKGTITPSITASGTVKAVRDTTLRATTEGCIIAYLVEEGDVVKAGQPLATFDTRDAELELGKILAQLTSARAELKDADLELGRTQALLQQKAVAPSKKDQDEARLDKARAEIGRLEAERDLAKRRLEKLTCTAPYDGRILQRHIHADDWVVPGNPLFWIADPDQLEVSCDVDESDATHIRVGGRAEVTAEGTETRRFPAAVTFVGSHASLEKESTVLEVKVRIPKGSDGLKVGYQVDVRIFLDERANALIVPPESLRRKDAGTVAMVLKGDCVKERLVTLGAQDIRHAEVTSGLQEGDTVALSPEVELKDGERVRPLPAP